MSHTQTVTVEVPVTLKVEVELAWNREMDDGWWTSHVTSIEGHPTTSDKLIVDRILDKITGSAHDIAVSQLP